MQEGLFAKLRALFEGESAVRKIVQDPATSAEILLLMRLVLADGVAEGTELEALKRICGDVFGLHGGDFDEVMTYLENYGYETSGPQAAAMFAELPEDRRKRLLQHMIIIAKADRTIDKREVQLIARAGQILGLDPRTLIGQAHGS